MSSSPPVKDGVKGSHPGLGNLRTSNAKIEKEFNDPFKVYLLCHDLQTLNRNKANDAKLHAKIVWNQFHI